MKLNAIKEIHSEGDKWSSKREYGGLLLIVSCACVLMRIEHPLLEPMLYTGAGLIGLYTTVKIAEAIKGTNGKTPPQQSNQ